MNKPNLNNHQLDKYIFEKIDQKDIVYDPSEWEKLKHMLYAHNVGNNQNVQTSFYNLTSLKFLGIIISILTLSFVITEFIAYKSKVTIEHTKDQNKDYRHPINIIDTSNLRLETKQKLKNPNLEEKMEQLKSQSIDFNQKQNRFDSTQSINEKNLLLDSLQIHKANDTIKSKKKHIFW